jgi:hypothetical protein
MTLSHFDISMITMLIGFVLLGMVIVLAAKVGTIMNLIQILLKRTKEK